jgi:DNA-binding HxlR family transcriptional regulator
MKLAVTRTGDSISMQWNELDQQPCSVSRTLSVIGDRWTLLILRDCFLRVRRFDDFQARLGRPILADRLQKLLDNFVLTKVAYQQNPKRYEYRLTQKGIDLYPVIMAIVHWGDVHMSGKKGRPLLHVHTKCGHQFDPLHTCSECGETLDAREVKVESGPGAADTAHMPIDAPKPRRIGRSA